MPVFKIRLKFLSSLKELPSSQTLYGALFWGTHYLFGEKKVSSLLRGFEEGAPPFILSSFFFTIKEDWYPLPSLPLPRVKDLVEEAFSHMQDFPRLRKEIEEKLGGKLPAEERARQQAQHQLLSSLLKSFSPGFVPENFLREMLNRKSDLKALFFNFLQEDPEGEKPLTFKTSVEPRARIDRLVFSTGGKGELYFEELTRAAEKREGFFLLRTEEKLLEEILLPSLRLIAEFGLGGNRSIGLGHFSYEGHEEVNEDFLEPRSHLCLLLSNTSPADERLIPESQDSSYILGSARPWRESLLGEGSEALPADRRFFFFRPGSILRTREPREFYGAAFPYRNGSKAKVILYGLPLFYKE